VKGSVLTIVWPQEYPRRPVENLDNILTGCLWREIVVYMKMHYPIELMKGLEAYGLDQKEAKVYLAGLELGATSVLELARRTKLPRTTLYPILEQLTTRGVFREGKQKSTTLYIAESPKQLVEKMRERESCLEDSLPALELLQETSHGGPGVIFYEGTEGFKRLWKLILNSGITEYRLLTSGVGLKDYVKEPYLIRRVVDERKKRGIRSRQLIRDGKDARQIIAKDSDELRESRLLPREISLPATVIIFGDQVAFITTRKENTMILLASGDVAGTYKTLFDLVWEKAEKPGTLAA
jgi:HTH-type transcriptional regulator, sugar sensing transcriptional regulator